MVREPEGDLVDEWQQKKGAIKPIQHAPMARKELARIFNTHLPFENTNGEVA